MNTLKKFVRVLCFCMGIIGEFLFWIPLVTHRILSVGNLTGIVISTVIIICAIFSGQIGNGVRSLRGTPAGKVALMGMGVCIFTAMIGITALSMLIYQGAKMNAPKDVTVVVLGCQVKGERASLVLRERLDAAYDYMEKHPTSKAVLSGGQGPGEQITEAECMYRYLVKKGVDGSRLYQENQSTSTEENMKFSYEIIQREELNPKIAIVTNEFHEYRAGFIADKIGLQSSSVPAKTVWWLFPTYFVREWFAIINETIIK